MKPSTSLSVLVLLLVSAFAWSGLAYGLNCACEVATGACAECCGAQDAGFKHCGIDGDGGPQPPAVLSVPKSMPAPPDLPPAVAPAAPEAAPEPHAADGKAGPPPGKSPIPDKTPDSTGKDKP